VGGVGEAAANRGPPAEGTGRAAVADGAAASREPDGEEREVTQQHVYTYDPFLGPPRELGKFTILAPREAAEPGVALVLLKEGKGFEALRETRRLTAGEVRWGRIRRIYRVDMSEHALQWQSWLNSQGDEWVLLAHVQIRCAVSDPVKVVEKNVHDAYTVLEPLLAERMRERVDDYGLGDRSRAERAITDSLRSAPVESEFFDIRWVGVRLSHDETVMAVKKRVLQTNSYVAQLQQGQWEPLALQLVNDGASIDNVVAQIMQQRNAEMDLQLKALLAYLDKGAMEGWQLEDPAKEILFRLARTWQAAAGGVPGTSRSGQQAIAGDTPTPGAQ
jgi:hypothetical protein